MLIANQLGQYILDGTVRPASFFGLPVVVVGAGLTSTSDDRWVVASSYIQPLRVAGVPMIGLNLDADTFQSTLDLAYALGRLSRFLAPGNRPVVWSDMRANAPLCGPFLAMPQRLFTWQSEVDAAVGASASFLGTTIGNVVGYGGLALGVESVGALAGPPPWETPYSPVVYRTNYPRSGGSYAEDVEQITTLWKIGAVPTVAQVAALSAAAAGRPGLTRRVPAYLFPWTAP